jgi:hypothetical protein
MLERYPRLAEPWLSGIADNGVGLVEGAQVTARGGTVSVGRDGVGMDVVETENERIFKRLSTMYPNKAY